MSDKILFPGESNNLIPGSEAVIPVEIYFDKEVKVRGIYATFYGAERTEAEYTQSSTDSEGHTTTTTHTAVEHVDIIKQASLLMGEERKGFFSRIGDSMATMMGGGSHTLIKPGKQEFEFQVSIPMDAPPSFSGKRCEVFYRLEVHVDVPIRVDWKEQKSFEIVLPPVDFQNTQPVHVTFPDSSGRSVWNKLFGKPVTLNVALDRNQFNPGDSAAGMLTVESPEPLKVKDITMTLVGTEQTHASGHSDEYQHRHELGNIDAPSLLTSDTTFEFEVKIPDLEGPFTESGNNFKVLWHVEVQLKIPWAKDPIIKVPIEIFSA